MSSAIRRDLDAMVVLAQYGRAMLAVQLFEVALAQLWLVASIDPSHSEDDLPTQLRRAVRRLVAAMQRMPAGALKHDLEDKIEPALLIDIEGRIKWRNVLAHRYLRERLRGRDERFFKPGTLEELTRLTADFEDLSKRITAEADRLRSEVSSQTPEPPDGVRRMFERLALEVLQGASHDPDS